MTPDDALLGSAALAGLHDQVPATRQERGQRLLPHRVRAAVEVREVPAPGEGGDSLDEAGLGDMDPGGVVPGANCKPHSPPGCA
ncbi:hypothetical protein ACFYP6_38315 [Streptomyces goshikiensis]|uniref:hypothetical protein n=1 Tax=Streptomyces goshikiensis TaxID=1942 RepID=UPI00368A7FE8